MANDRTVDRGEAQLQFLPNQNRSRSPAKRKGKHAMNKSEKTDSGLNRRDLLRKHGGK